MSLIDQLNDDMKSAMKAGDKLRLSTLRMMISAVRYVGIDLSAQAGAGEMTDDMVVEVLQKEAKKRRESIEAYTAGGRAETAAQEKQELAIVEEYLPKMMSEEEVRLRVKELLSRGVTGNMGQVIGMAMKELQGKADGGMVARVVREMYTNGQ